MGYININFFSTLSFKSAFAALTIVPPESIMSSTIIQVFFLTFPTIFITSDFPGEMVFFYLQLLYQQLIFLPKALALSTPPTSGATQTKLLFFIFFFICLANIGVVNKLSTGISKNPWI